MMTGAAKKRIVAGVVAPLLTLTSAAMEVSSSQPPAHAAPAFCQACAPKNIIEAAVPCLAAALELCDSSIGTSTPGEVVVTRISSFTTNTRVHANHYKYTHHTHGGSFRLVDNPTAEIL